MAGDRYRTADPELSGDIERPPDQGEDGVSSENQGLLRNPERLGQYFGKGFAHLAWGADLGLPGTSTGAVPLYTLTDRQAWEGPAGVWEWQYRGRYQSGTESNWLSEKTVRDMRQKSTLKGDGGLLAGYTGGTVIRGR